MSAKITGSFFPSEDSRMSVKDQTIGDKTKVFISFGVELMAVITEGQARDLDRWLSQVLREIDDHRA